MLYSEVWSDSHCTSILWLRLPLIHHIHLHYIVAGWDFRLNTWLCERHTLRNLYWVLLGVLSDS